jgi:hypothetical protein
MLAETEHVAERIEAAVANHYGTSGGFNGLPLVQLPRLLHLRAATVETTVTRLVAAGRLSAVFGDVHPNPAIRALPDEPVADQLAKLSRLKTSAWLYPTPQMLRTTVKAGAHRGRPFTKRLARGEHQFAFYAFDPIILTMYRDDPRYLYCDSHFGGHVSIRDEFFECGRMYKRDEVLLKSFGFCFGPNGERVVAGLLYDLAKLSPEHQQNWNNRRLKGDFRLHPAFWRWVNGGWPTGLSIFSAVLAEIAVVNQLCALMRKPHLFRDAFSDCPVRFTFLLVPTVDEYNAFVQVLDKVVVENIAEEFFGGDIEPFKFHNRGDGVIERERKRPITMLAEWFEAFYTGSESHEIISTLRKIRRLRNKPAHTIQANMYDLALREAQHTLMSETHEAIRLIRMILQTDRACRNFKLPRFVDDGSKIWIR